MPTNPVIRLIAGWLWAALTRPGGQVRRVSIEALDDLKDRGALLALEAGAQANQTLRLLIVAVLGCLAGFAATLWLSIAIVLLSWDSPSRDIAIILVAGAWVCLAAGLIGWVRATFARRVRAFDQTRTLLDEDLKSLRTLLDSQATGQ